MEITELRERVDKGLKCRADTKHGCQQVCPYRRDHDDHYFACRTDLIAKDALELLQMYERMEDDLK